MASPSNMLWNLLQAQPHDEESIMQCLYDHPDCCSLVIDDKLAIHVAIEQCLSMDIIKQMLICYPACCSRMNKRGNLLLHLLLRMQRFFQIYYPNSYLVTSEIIHLVIDTNPEALRDADDVGFLPLHMECGNNCDRDVIMKLLDLYPEAISIKRLDGSLPLQAALRSHNGTSDAILYLIDAYPDAVRILHERQDGQSLGDLALHYECKNLCRYDIIVKLLDVYPEAIRIFDKLGSPLNFALTNQICVPTKTIIYLIDAFPDIVYTTDVNDELPLHVECRNQCRYEVIKKLNDIYPDAIIIVGNSSYYPLDWAILSVNNSSESILYILSLYPEAVYLRVKNTASVLHMECGNQCRFDVIMELLAIYPDAISIAHHQNGRYPLHQTLDSGNSSVETILHLVSLYPHATSAVGYQRSDIPLNLECKYQCRYEVVKKLFEVYPEAIRSDCCPLLDALFSDHSSSEVVLYLIDLYPDAARVATYLGHYAFHIECMRHCRYDIIARLLDVYPDVISMADNKGYLPLHMLLLKKSLPSIKLIEMIYSKYPQAATTPITIHHTMIMPLCHVFTFYYHWRINRDYSKLPSSQEIDPNNTINSETHKKSKNITYNQWSVYTGLYSVQDQQYPLNVPYSYKIMSQYKSAFMILIDAYQHLLESSGSNIMNLLGNKGDIRMYRVLLNLLSHCLSPPMKSMHGYGDRNYKPRACVLHHIYQTSSFYSTSVPSTAIHSSSGQHNDHRLTSKVPDSSGMHMKSFLYVVILNMLDVAGRVMSTIEKEADGSKYSWMKGDDIGCVLLRKVVLYL